MIVLDPVVVSGEQADLAAAFQPSAPTVVFARPRLRSKVGRDEAAEVFRRLDGKVCRAVVCVHYADPRWMTIVPAQWRYRSVVHFRYATAYVFEPRMAVVPCPGARGLDADVFGLDRMRALVRSFVVPGQYVLDALCSDEYVLQAAREHGHHSVGWAPSWETTDSVRRSLRQLELFNSDRQVQLTL